MARFACWLVALLVVAASIANATAQVHVRGYYRKNGTYVAPHVRSSPNSSRTDNYSSRGNYNPYTGQRGTIDPYRDSQPRRHAPAATYRPSPSYVAQPYVAPLPPPAPVHGSSVSVWRCLDANNRPWYLAYPRAGCTEILVRPALATMVAQTPIIRPRQYFNGDPCTVDCSGHEAGYDWADENGIDDPDDCGGNSQSFIEGCEGYAEERQEEMIEDGDCDDDDEDGLCD